jgi:hypothetical protein
MSKFEVGDKLRIKKNTVGNYPSYLRGRDCTIIDIRHTQQTATQLFGVPLNGNLETPSIHYTVRIVPRYSNEDADHELIREEDLEPIW